MAYPVSLAQLKARVLQRTNLEGAVGSNKLITLEELTDDINQSISKWYDEVRGTTWNGAYYRAPFTFMTSNVIGSSTQNPPANAIYALPADFLSATSVDCFISPSMVISATAFQEEQRNWYRFWTGAVGWFLGTTIYYQIQGAGSGGTPYIVFLPPPQSIFQIQVNYVPVAPVLQDPENSIDSINGWEEFIVLDSAIKLLMKTGRQEEIPIFMQMMEQERQRIRKMAPRRDQYQAERVHEVNREDDGWTY